MLSPFADLECLVILGWNYSTIFCYPQQEILSTLGVCSMHMKEEYTDVYFGNTMFWSFMFITILEFLSSNHHRKPCKNTRKPSLKTSCTPPIPTAFQRLQPASRCSRRGATLWCCNLEVGSVTPHSSTVGETVVTEQPGGSPRWTTAGHHSAQELSSLCCIMHWSLSIFCGCQQIHVQVLKKKITKQCKLQDKLGMGKILRRAFHWKFSW